MVLDSIKERAFIYLPGIEIRQTVQLSYHIWTVKGTQENRRTQTGPL